MVVVIIVIYYIFNIVYYTSYSNTTVLRTIDPIKIYRTVRPHSMMAMQTYDEVHSKITINYKIQVAISEKCGIIVVW